MRRFIWNFQKFWLIQTPAPEEDALSTFLNPPHFLLGGVESCHWGRQHLPQALTRVSISRKSREEMTHIFLSRAGELCFHFSFSSWFSRFLDKKSLALLDLWDFQNNSLSLLDFQDCEEKVLFLLSIYEILFTVSLSLPVRNATYLREKYVFFKVWDVVAKCYGMRFWGGFGVRKGPLLIKI